MPRFSVLMPTHNRADVIDFSVRSILAQTQPDFELIIVGDGCTDNTADVIAKHKDKRIRWLDFPKAPFSGYANRNLALQQAKGDLIAYAQDDDLMLPDHLALVDKMMSPAIDWAYTRPLWVTIDGIIVPSGTNLMIDEELKVFFEERNTIPSCCVVHRRECLERFGFWPEDVARIADWKLWHKLIGGCGRERISYLPTPSTLHFNAVWREISRHSGVPEVLTWLTIIDKSTWWPPVLRHDIPGPRQEQRVLFEALQEGGDAFVSALRKAVDSVINWQAWNGILNLQPRIAYFETKLAERETVLQSLTSDVVNLNSQLAQKNASLEEAAAAISVLQARITAIVAERDTEVAILRQKLNAILNSRS